MDEAVKLLIQMMARGLAPDTIHYTCLINGYCLKGEIQSALQVFERMLKENIKPDLVTYNVLISGFFQRGLVTVVDDLLDHMIDQGLENSLTYGLAISGFCRGGHLSKAEEIFSKVGKRLDNTEVLYNAYGSWLFAFRFH